MHWAKFNQAIEDLTTNVRRVKKLSCNSDTDEFEKDCITIRRHLQRSEYFYIPDAAQLLNAEEVYPNDVQPPDYLYQLPFERVSILSELHVLDQLTLEKQLWKITCAQQVAPLQIKIWSVVTAPPNSLREDLPIRGWIPAGPGARTLKEDGESKVGFHSENISYWRRKMVEYGLDPARLLQEHRDDLVAVYSLTTLLNLNNSEMVSTPVPSKLNSKRASRGKSQLKSYHVLKIAGEVWDRQETSGNVGPGVRSHKRRGHVRHLASGKTTWVKSTVVHGSVPGWVNKEYHLQ